MEGHRHSSLWVLVLVAQKAVSSNLGGDGTEELLFGGVLSQMFLQQLSHLLMFQLFLARDAYLSC